MNLTKIIFNTMKGAPVLASEWGSLLNVIRTVCKYDIQDLIKDSMVEINDASS